MIQRKTKTPVQFEITIQTRKSVESWIRIANLNYDDYLFKSRLRHSVHLSKRQYSRIVKSWVSEIGLDPVMYGTHSLRRTKVTLIYRRTKNLRAVQLLLGHKSLESTVKYASSNLILIAQISLSLKGCFWPINLPWFQGDRFSRIVWFIIVHTVG